MHRYDAILIPGGGLDPDGFPAPWVRSRLDLAIVRAEGAYLMPLSAGTPHKPPPLDSRGYPVLESVASARYLAARGADARKILPETCSLDTIGNAYFSRVVHAAPRGLRRLLTITSTFHMPRAEAVFRWVYGLEGPGGDFVLRFEATADTGLSAAALEARRRKESERMAALPALEARIRTLAELHDWLFSEHRAYAVSGYAEGGRDEQADGAILESY